MEESYSRFRYSRGLASLLYYTILQYCTSDSQELRQGLPRYKCFVTVHRHGWNQFPFWITCNLFPKAPHKKKLCISSIPRLSIPTKVLIKHSSKVYSVNIKHCRYCNMTSSLTHLTRVHDYMLHVYSITYMLVLYFLSVLLPDSLLAGQALPLWER